MDPVLFCRAMLLISLFTLRPSIGRAIQKGGRFSLGLREAERAEMLVLLAALYAGLRGVDASGDPL
jgi:hypothetical protein